jgi:SAM-dependent methyltransferase
VARHWVAPGAQFVCGDGELPLPFADGALAASLCADALHHFDRKRECLDELRRCTAGGTIVVAGVGNLLVEPREGEECTPGGYAALLAPWPYRLRSEAELVGRYVRGEGPDLADPAVRQPFEGGKWLYYVASEDPAMLRTHGALGTWPHASGRLALNPLYSLRARGGAFDLTLRFPSPWYAFENGALAEYHPRNVTVDARTLDAVAHGRRTPKVEELLAQFVVVGLPERYARDSGRRRAAAAHRALTFLLRDVIPSYRGTARGYQAAG